MRGVPLTPEQVAAIATEYARTGNYAAAGRVVGVAESVARRACLRHRESDRVALHARACDRALRDARRQVAAVARVVARVVAEESGAGVSLEPRDLAALANTLARLTEARIALADREDRRRGARLTRDKTRAEVAALRARPTEASGDVVVVVRVAGDPPPVDADAPTG